DLQLINSDLAFVDSTTVVSWRIDLIGVLCRFRQLELRAEATALDGVGIALQYLEIRLTTVPPESDLKSLFADPKVRYGQIRQPLRQHRINAQLLPRRVRPEPEHRLHQCEDRACRPGLRYVGPKVLDGKIYFVTLGRRIELGQLVEQEVACRATDVAGYPC